MCTGENAPSFSPTSIKRYSGIMAEQDTGNAVLGLLGPKLMSKRANSLSCPCAHGNLSRLVGSVANKFGGKAGDELYFISTISVGKLLSACRSR